ncbi:MAG: RluA family pseudouridine synthase [Candidatus Saccharibacteria bacterium]|nr:RluA family pseudouridine synthase [Candidatus Saccharibacteria bacterium]
MALKELVVNEEQKGRRFDVVAAEMLPMLSRAFVHRLINQGQFLVNDNTQKPGYKLRTGDSISTDVEIADLDSVADIDLPVIYEDSNVLVIDKPVGVISHSRGRYWNEPSVASFVRQRVFTNSRLSHLDGRQGADEAQTEPYIKYGEGALESATQPDAKSSGSLSDSAGKQDAAVQSFEGERAGIVHRLDRATSGVMICAKNQMTLKHLQQQFSNRSVKKRYLAIVDGHMNDNEAVIDMPIERNPIKPQTFRTGANGKPAQTHYSVIKKLKEHSVVALTPRTGRTHQLRVHLSYIKHPIVGDVLYSGETAERLYLHAMELVIKLPNSQYATKFVAPKPESFKSFEKKHG